MALNLPPLLAFAPAGTLFGSLIVTVVLAAYLNATQRRARDIRALAASLARTNHELQRRIDEHYRTAAALGESERKYRDIYENAVEGIFQTSPDGRMLSANPALARIYGYETPEEVLEALQDVSQQLYVDPSSRTEFVRSAGKAGRHLQLRVRNHRARTDGGSGSTKPPAPCATAWAACFTMRARSRT